MGQAAGAHAIEGEAGAAILLEEVEDQLALAEAVEERRHGADVDGVRGEPEQVRGDALQLAQEGADVARPRRHHQAHQLLHRPHVGEVVGGRGHVIHAVGVGDVLEERVQLEELLRAAVEVADDRIAVHDPLAVHLELQPQHAVGRGMLGAEVQLHLLLAVEEGVAQRIVPEGLHERLIHDGFSAGGSGGLAGFQPVPVPATGPAVSS